MLSIITNSFNQRVIEMVWGRSEHPVALATMYDTGFLNGIMGFDHLIKDGVFSNDAPNVQLWK